MWESWTRIGKTIISKQGSGNLRKGYPIIKADIQLIQTSKFDSLSVPSYVRNNKLYYSLV